jgi:hypothetical protein
MTFNRDGPKSMLALFTRCAKERRCQGRVDSKMCLLEGENVLLLVFKCLQVGCATSVQHNRWSTLKVVDIITSWVEHLLEQFFS